MRKTVTCDIGIVQCENRTVKCGKKSKGTTKCEKRTVMYDVGIAPCELGTVKYEKKVT